MPEVRVGPFSKGPTINRNSGEDNPLGYNILKIGAQKVWKECRANGAGIIVMNIDCGVRATHEAIANRFLFGYDCTTLPDCTVGIDDENGHGTHTMGTMAGSKASGVGVAPGACWIACKGCAEDSCPSDALYMCAQKVLLICVFLPEWCPHIISNSWGSLPLIGSNTWFNDVVEAWTCVGILSVFAFGNMGPFCFSGGAPGNNPNIFAVGSTNEDDELSVYSSKGPGIQIGGLLQKIINDEDDPGLASLSIYQQPGVAAPGENVLSCGITNDTAYATMSGTSMATPCVAGTLALILSHICKSLNFSQPVIPSQSETHICRRCDIPGDNFIYKHLFQDIMVSLLESTANQCNMTVPFISTSFLPFLNFKCLEIDLDEEQRKWPNYQFGHGRISAIDACDKAISCSKES